MPLQNRVDPQGQIQAVASRGMMMGNRGGRIHDPATQTLTRNSASKRWICCVIEFKKRQRTVMGKGYTELFFLDEVTALASGHRPCFECRRTEAKHFAQNWQSTHGTIDGSVADGMDKVLHSERFPFDNRPFVDTKLLSDAAMFQFDDVTLVKRNGKLLIWSYGGYTVWKAEPPTKAQLLTPLSVVQVLANGYKPIWHPTAD